LIAIQILFVQGLPPRFVLVLMQKNLLLYRDVSVWRINCALDRNKKSNHLVPEIRCEAPNLTENQSDSDTQRVKTAICATTSGISD